MSYHKLDAPAVDPSDSWQSRLTRMERVLPSDGAMTATPKNSHISAAILGPNQTALRCAFLIAGHHGVSLPAPDFSLTDAGDMMGAVRKFLGAHGFACRELKNSDWRKAVGLGSAYPALAVLRSGHWVVLVGLPNDDADAGKCVVLDPRSERAGMQVWTREEFCEAWDGRLLLARHAPDADDASRPFGFAWFIPELMRQRHLLWGVAAAAMVANLVGFAMPLLFQVLIDKVIAHQAWNTLFVVVLIFVLLASFDAGFAYVRQRLMAIAGGKVDAKLGARVFGHLQSLPLTFFETHAAGVLVRHVQQTEKLRLFLTGKLFQTLLDAAFLPLLILLLLAYSPTLTAIVLGFALAIAAVIASLLPAFRRRLQALYTAEASRQAHLVETLHNMRAVKALTLESSRQKGWDAGLSSAVRKQWDVAALSAFGGALTKWLEKLMQISVLATGAILAFDGLLSLGALVAFSMLSQRVTGPLLQMINLINEYQEAALSLAMLGEIMNRPPETAGPPRPARPVVTGDIRIEDLSFAYPGAKTQAIDGLSLTIQSGMTIGVVGRSGSGKTTLTRLLQGVETPQSGTIYIEGVDIRHIDLQHLRRSLGLVLQENLLFRGSIRDNIRAARPSANHEDVVNAARLAAAEEFILRLPQSYDTQVEEGGTNLSGGQRQRIAIARALISSPPVLILDEATSALDPESEGMINRNLSEIALGRTMILVSHRMSSLVHCDAILVLEKGQMVDFARHDRLLTRCDIYRSLWEQQTEHVA